MTACVLSLESIDASKLHYSYDGSMKEIQNKCRQTPENLYDMNCKFISMNKNEIWEKKEIQKWLKTVKT